MIFWGRGLIDDELIAHPPLNEGSFAARMMERLHRRRLPER